MSVVCILTPAVIAGWPAFSAAVVAAAASLGYSVVDEAVAAGRSTNESTRRVQLEIEQSELVSGTLQRDRRLTVSREGVTVTFSRDARGKASLCVSGEGHSDADLRARGEELAQGVVQQYVYQRLKEEIGNRRFAVVEEENGEDRSIRIKVRHWEN